MEIEIAKILLDIGAVHLNPDNFFTWTSGIKSPIYCDNRQIISYPEHRKIIIQYFIDVINSTYPQTQIIAGTATAGIPWAAWIADKMNLPMIYVRSKSKGHGLKNAIEGNIEKDKRTIVIEDLISTGTSSIDASKVVRDTGMKLCGVISIFNYGFPFAVNAFRKEKITTSSLGNLDAMLVYALENKLLSQKQIDIINQWKNSKS